MPDQVVPKPEVVPDVSPHLALVTPMRMDGILIWEALDALIGYESLEEQGEFRGSMYLPPRTDCNWETAD